VVRKQTRLLERKEQCEVAKQFKSNPKKFRKYVNSESKLHTKNGDIKSTRSDGQVSVATDDDNRANVHVLGDFFADVYTCEPVDFHIDIQQLHVIALFFH